MVKNNNDVEAVAKTETETRIESVPFGWGQGSDFAYPRTTDKINFL